MNCIDIQKTNLEPHLVCALGFITTCTEKKSVVFKLYLKPLLTKVRTKVASAPISLIFSNQEKETFDLVSLAIVLCSFLSADLIIVQEVLLWRFNRCRS